MSARSDEPELGDHSVSHRLSRQPGKESLMDNRFEVTVSAGTLMSASGAVVRFPHRWTPGGVTVEADFTGGHPLPLPAARCGPNEVYPETAGAGIEYQSTLPRM